MVRYQIGAPPGSRRAILESVQPHWAALAALAAAAIGAYSSAQASKKAQAASAASDLASKQAAGSQPKPFESVASQFAKPQGFDPNQRTQDALAQENQQNEQRLRALETGRPVSSVFSQAGAAPAAQPRPSYMAGTQVQPGAGPEAYNLSNVPQTTQQGGGSNLGQYANMIGAASQLGQSFQGQPPPSGGLPSNPAPNYQPTALAQLQALIQARQGRRYY
jgi:hypothetical protein